MALNHVRNEIMDALSLHDGMSEQALHVFLLNKYDRPRWFSRMRKPSVSLHELRDVLSALVSNNFLRTEWKGTTASPYRPVRYFLVR